MPPTAALTPESFTNFGDLLHYLRRRARLTQTELGNAVGYSNGQISRLEQNRRQADPATITALFVPALYLNNEPAWVARLLHLAAEARQSDESESAPDGESAPRSERRLAIIESIPRPAPYEVDRPALLTRIQTRLNSERQVALCALGGLGKTTLAAAVARAQRGPVFWITFTSNINTAVDALVKQLAAFLTAHQQKQVEPLLRASDSPLPFNQQVALLTSALNSLGQAEAQTLLCFDNFHLIQNDSTLVQMVRHLIASTTVRLLLTSREEIPFPEITQIDLVGFEPAEGQQLIERLAADRAIPSPLDPLLAAHLIDKTGGSPMLMRLALGQLLDHRTDLVNFVSQLETQPQVAAYLLDTVQRQLSPETWRLLTQISVFHQPINLYDDLLVELIREENGGFGLAPALAELQHRQIIDHPQQATLHPLIRDYVYATLATDPARRRRLQLVAAEWAERGPRDSLRAARHYAQAGRAEHVAELLMGDEKTLIQHGQALTAVTILDEALAHTRKQRSLNKDVLRKLLAVRGNLLSGTVRQNEAEQNYQDALALTDNAAVRADLAYRLGLIYSFKGRYTETLELIQTAVEALAPTDTLLLAQLYAVQAQALYRLARYVESEDRVKQTLLLSQPLTTLGLPVVSEIMYRANYVQADLHRVRANYAAALANWQAAAALARQAKNLRLENAALVCIGGVEYDLGHLNEAWRIRSEALATAQRIGHAYLQGYALMHLADIHHARCEFEAELEKLILAEELLARTEDRIGLSNSVSQRASAMLALGRPAEARPLLESLLLQVKAASVAPRLQAQYLGHTGQLYAIEGQLSLAEATLNQALALPTIHDMPVIQNRLKHYLVIILLAQNKRVTAESVLVEMPLQSENLWIDLQRKLIGAVFDLCNGNLPAAESALATILARAQETGHRFLETQTARLQPTLNTPLDPTNLPKRLWVLTNSPQEN